jgi:hypothetical protein
MRFSHHAVTPTMPTSVEAPIVCVKQGALVQYFNILIRVFCAAISRRVWFSVVTDDGRQDNIYSSKHGLFR